MTLQLVARKVAAGETAPPAPPNFPPSSPLTSPPSSTNVATGRSADLYRVRKNAGNDAQPEKLPGARYWSRHLQGT